MTTKPPSGLSVWERDLYGRLARHLEAEPPLIAAYARLAEESESDYVKYLVSLILEDEARHHRMMQELLRSLCSSVAPDGREGGLPSVRRVAQAQDLLDVTDRLLALEKDDKQSLRQLRRELRDVRDTSVWDLVVDTMGRDTEKHMAILEFLRARLAASASAR